MNLFSKAVSVSMKTSLLLVATSFFAITVHAALLGINISEPRIFFNKDLTVPESTTYNASSELFNVTATPELFRLPGTPSTSVSDSSSEGPKKLTVSIQVDNSGMLIGSGANGHDLVLVGAVNDGGVVADGVLLTAEITGFGFADGGNTDTFDMTFRITGGQLANLYPSNTVGILFLSEGSSFTDFTIDFGGNAKGYVTKIASTPIPEVAICTLVNFDGVSPYLDADDITGDSCGGYIQTIPSGDLGLDAFYKLVVTNTGTDTLINIDISDPTLGLINVPLPGGPLLAGDMRMVDASDLGFGNLKYPNRCAGSLGEKSTIASVLATGEQSGFTVGDDDPASIICTATPKIDILTEVSVDGGMNFYDANDPATAVFANNMQDAQYKLTVTNTGTEDLESVKITDSTGNIVDLGIDDLAVDDSVMLLSDDPGFGTLFVTLICEGVNGDVFYGADVSGVGVASGDTVTDSDPALVMCTEPRISIRKQVSIDGGTEFFEADAATDLDVPVGIVDETDAVYRYIVKNIGPEVLTDVVITDAILMINASIDDLAPDEEREFYFDTNSDFTNLEVNNVCTDLGYINGNAFVNAIGDMSMATTSDQNPAYLNCLTRPEIDILTEVSVDGGVNFFDANTLASAVFASSLSDAEYRLTVTNTSNEVLVDVMLNDSASNIMNADIGSFAIDEVKTFTKADFPSLFVSEICVKNGNGDIYYDADVNGLGALSNISVNDTDPAVVICGNPVIMIQKQVSLNDGANWYEADQLTDMDVPVGVVGHANALYRYIVKNLGTEVLVDVVISDDDLMISQQIAELAINETRVIDANDMYFSELEVLDVCDIVGGKGGPALVNANGKDSGSPASSENPAFLLCIEEPQIMLLNQVSLTDGAPFFEADTAADAVDGLVGDDATYRYIIKNVGNETLNNIKLNDSALSVSNFPVIDAMTGLPLILAPGQQYIVDVPDLSNLFFPGRCNVAGNKLNKAFVNADGINSGMAVEDTNDANVNCEQAPVCGLTLTQQCAIVNLPTSDDLLCEAKIAKTKLKYTGPTIYGATVKFEGKNGGLAIYTDVDLIENETILTSAGQGGYTVSGSSTGETDLGSKTYIYINNVLEIIHTSCSAVYYAGRPAPLDGNTPNPANSEKGDPSPNWFVVDFEDKEGGYVTSGTGQPGTFSDSCSAVSNTDVEMLFLYTVTNTGNTAIDLTSISDNRLGEVLVNIPSSILPGDEYSVQTSRQVSGSYTQSAVAMANVIGNSANMCDANASVDIAIEAPMEEVTCSDIKPLTSLSLIYRGADGVDIQTEMGEKFTNVQDGNKITFLLADTNDTEIYLSGAQTGKSTFHKSCSDREMNGNEHCGMAQGNGKNNDAGLNTFLLEGMIGEEGSFACNTANTVEVFPTAGGGGKPYDDHDSKDKDHKGKSKGKKHDGKDKDHKGKSKDKKHDGKDKDHKGKSKDKDHDDNCKDKSHKGHSKDKDHDGKDKHHKGKYKK